MPKTIRATFVYFTIVLGTGFVLGMFRVPILVPRIGERWAELAEMPIMATVIVGLGVNCALTRIRRHAKASPFKPFAGKYKRSDA